MIANHLAKKRFFFGTPGICDFLQVTVDTPSQHESGYMHILDIAVKVHQNKIVYKSYKKPIAIPIGTAFDYIRCIFSLNS